MEVASSQADAERAAPPRTDWASQPRLPVVEGEAEASAEVRHELRAAFEACGLHRPFRLSRYDPGSVLEVNLEGVAPATAGRARLRLERFCGGGFAGQVYRARLVSLSWRGEPVPGLEVGKRYAIKLLRPPGSFARGFRNALYRIGFQAPFSLQTNRDAVRAGALWQKLLRRAVKLRFGSERHAADVHATFFDPGLEAFGEILEWVDGRLWKLESDARLFERGAYLAWEQAPPDAPSPEYLEKHVFMRKLVALLREVGAEETARQYEWGTWKSQPNVLKRLDGAGELCAIDWRPGLALLAPLPMSPADFGLVLRGLARGRLVQFDGADVSKLEAFVSAHGEAFADLRPALAELKSAEAAYRAGLPDGLNRPWRLLTRLPFCGEVRAAAAASWQRLGLLDDGSAARTARSAPRFWLCYALWWLPIVGHFLLRMLGSSSYRRHVGMMLGSPGYAARGLRGWRIETLLRWHRNGRVGDRKALARVEQPVEFALERLLVGWWPRAWHRFVTDGDYAKALLKAWIGFPLRFYASAEFREAWLLERVRKALAEGMLEAVEEARIEAHIRDPFIQKYLKCMAVHLCLSPVTTLLRFGLAIYFSVWLGESWHDSLAIAVAVLAAIQLLPVTPGSVARGLYVIWLMIRERNTRDYRIAAFVSFWHYIGYLGFPLQMATRFPALARFLTARWAKRIVSFVPVFGEAGGLLEHKVFDLFFNLPISLHARWAAPSPTGEEIPA
ncbi:MAG: hypothetical protein M5U26_22730 [Planctomycetota bacterium]|nr:hypothetical protein [Planctomycetota bacterium]